MPYVLRNHDNQYVSDIYESVAVLDAKEYTRDVNQAIVFKDLVAANKFIKEHYRLLSKFEPEFTVRQPFSTFNYEKIRFRRLEEFSIET